MPITLVGTTESLEVVLGGSVSSVQPEVNAAGVDLLTSDQSLSAVLGSHLATNGATPVTAIAAPASGHTRTVKEVSVYNKDSAVVDVTLQVNVGGTRFIVEKITGLAVGATFLYQG